MSEILNETGLRFAAIALCKRADGDDSRFKHMEPVYMDEARASVTAYLKAIANSDGQQCNEQSAQDLSRASDAHGDGYCGCTERCKDRDNCQYDVKPQELNDQDEVLLAYGLLWCVNTTDQRVHSARRELLKCLNKDLQAKAISAARTTLALVRDIRQMKGATFACDFAAEPIGYLYAFDGCEEETFSRVRKSEYMRNEPWTETLLYAAPALTEQPPEAPPSAPDVREALEWVRGEIFALCEATEDSARDGQDFSRGRCLEAKRMRRAMGEVIRERLAALSQQPVAVADRGAIIRECASIAVDHTPKKFEGTLAAHATGRAIECAILALLSAQPAKGER